MEKVTEIINKIQEYQFTVTDELILQQELFDLVLKKENFEKEFKLNKKSRIDFFNKDLRIGIEVKIKGSAVSIYRQCERYIKTGQIDIFILLTAKSMGMPEDINGIPVIVISLGRSWL